MTEITDQLMDKLLYMARLEMSPAAREQMKKELNTMVNWLHQLRELDTNDITPLTTMSRETNKLREDIPVPPLSAEQALHNAPDRSSHYFRTPAVKEGA